MSNLDESVIESIKKSDDYKRSKILGELWKDQKSHNIIDLRENNIINNHDLFGFTYYMMDGKKFDFSTLSSFYEEIEKYIQQDGLYICKQVMMNHLSSDRTLEYLKSWIKIGTSFDYDKLFYYCFSNKSKAASDLILYLLEYHSISIDTINSIAYPAWLKYTKKDPVITALTGHGMSYFEPEVKKTKLLSEFSCLENESLSDIQFLDENIIAIYTDNCIDRSKKINIFDLACRQSIITFGNQVDFNHEVNLCLWKKGVAVLSKSTLLHIPIDKTIESESIFLSEDGLLSTHGCDTSSIISYNIEGMDTLAQLTHDAFSRTPSILNIKSLDDETILLRYSSPESLSGRALGLIKVVNEQATLVNVYKEMNDPGIQKALGIGPYYKYIYLREIAIYDDRIWCLVEGSTLNDLLGSDHPESTVTCYRLKGTAARDDSTQKKNMLGELLGAFKKYRKVDESSFSHEDVLLKIEGRKTFFSDSGSCIISIIKGKNKLHFHTTKGAELLHEIRLTKSQSLANIKLSEAVVRIYDSNRFIVYGKSQWNLCEVITTS